MRPCLDHYLTSSPIRNLSHYCLPATPVPLLFLEHSKQPPTPGAFVQCILPRYPHDSHMRLYSYQSIRPHRQANLDHSFQDHLLIHKSTWPLFADTQLLQSTLLYSIVCYVFTCLLSDFPWENVKFTREGSWKFEVLRIVCLVMRVFFWGGEWIA